MTRGVSWFVVGSLVLVALAGCGRGFMTAEREPWRAEAEKACLKSGAVKETADLVRIDPISGPGACGAEFPLKVVALGDPMSSLGYADDLRPPGSIGNQPRWPVSQQPSSYQQPSYASQPPSYPSQQPYQAQRPYPSQSGAPMQLNAPGVAPPNEEDIEAASDAPSPAPSRAPRAPYAAQPYPPASQPYTPPRLGPSQGSAVNRFGSVTLKPAATLACPIVSALDRWLADSVQPAAQRWFGSPVAEIRQISAYSCAHERQLALAYFRTRLRQRARHRVVHACGRKAHFGQGRLERLAGRTGIPARYSGRSVPAVQHRAGAGFERLPLRSHSRRPDASRKRPRYLPARRRVGRGDCVARGARGGYAGRDNGITGSIGNRVKSVFARGPLSKEDRESIEDESRVRER